MKAIDFFCFTSRAIRPFMLGFLIFHALPAIAKPPNAETSNPSKKLDLTLPKKYSEPDTVYSISRRHKRTISNLQAEKETNKEPNIGCGMDVTPLASSDASFGNRVVGKCKLSYYY